MLHVSNPFSDLRSKIAFFSVGWPSTKKICQLLGIWEFSNTSGMGNSKHCEIGFPSNKIHLQILHSSVTDSWKRRLISALTCFSHLWNTWPCYPSTPFSSQLSRMIKSHNCGKQTTFALTLSLFPFLIHNLHRIAAENHLLAAVATDLLSTSQRNNWIGNWVASRFHKQCLRNTAGHHPAWGMRTREEGMNLSHPKETQERYSPKVCRGFVSDPRVTTQLTMNFNWLPYQC